jgi:hypothetical protein
MGDQLARLTGNLAVDQNVRAGLGVPRDQANAWRDGAAYARQLV